jgi:hypothetical protein
MPDRTFSASYDSTTKVISAVTCLVLIAVAWAVHIVFVAALLPLLVVFAYAYSPRGYRLSGQAIVIKRLIGNIQVPLAGIREIRAGTPDDFTGCLRLWGNGGIFGYYGIFQTSKLGKCYWYVTNRSKPVIVATETRILVLSPDDVAGFMAAATGLCPHASSGAQPQLQPGGAGSNFTGLIAGVGLAALVLTFIILTVLYSPGPPGYTLTADRLTIHDRFYPVTLQAAAIDAGHLRIVDLARESAWRPTSRTNGFANMHYQSGWFRVANGQTVRLYRAGGNRLVLIPPKGGSAPVLYQAKDPERFVRELQHAFAGVLRGRLLLAPFP